MSEDSPVYDAPTIMVTTDDGTLFNCTPKLIWSFNSPRRPRWTFTDVQKAAYLGPPFVRECSSPVEVQRMLSEWWEGKKVLGQAGVSADRLRGWIVDGR